MHGRGRVLSLAVVRASLAGCLASILARRIALSPWLALLVVVLAVVAVLAVTWVRRPFPTTGASSRCQGLTGQGHGASATSSGIPQIYADNAEDLFRAQGFVHAQDRFFEMDLRRHITAGRLSELVGKGGLETDKVIRTLGWRRVAEAELPTLKPETRQYLQAYADGVNAYIHQQGRPSKMSLEYAVLGQKVPDYRVEDWTPADSPRLAQGDGVGPARRLQRRAHPGPARRPRCRVSQINELYPPYPYDQHQPILSAQDWSPQSQRRQPASAAPRLAPCRALPSRASEPGSRRQRRTRMPPSQRRSHAVPVTLGRGDGIGSNSWVVSGSRTSTGKPLLANDPHLGVGIPGIWYQVGLHCRIGRQRLPVRRQPASRSPGCPASSSATTSRSPGASPTSAPTSATSSSSRSAATPTCATASRCPLTSARRRSRSPAAATRRSPCAAPCTGRSCPTRSTTVAEAGERAPPVNGRTQPGQRTTCRSPWTGLRSRARPPTRSSGSTRRPNFHEFREAAALVRGARRRTSLYADTAGHIGYQAPGQIPIRRSATSGGAAGLLAGAGLGLELGLEGLRAVRRRCRTPTTRPRASSSRPTRP